MKMQRNRCPYTCLAVLALAALLLTFSGAPSAAQTAGAGTINGSVSDASGAAIPGASVTVINTDTGVSHDYKTNESGIYTAPFLQSGHYTIMATGAGFGKTESRGINLIVGQVLTVNLGLKVSTESTTVEVAAAPDILDTQRMEVSQVVDSHLVASLPVNARNWSGFVLLTPNVSQDGGTGLISFHGISGLYNQNYVDGANNNQMLFSEARGRSNGSPYVYSVDSIKEFQAETSNYSVEFGQAAGGQVNAITKSGTNVLHGDLFYFLRYPDLNALDPFTKYSALYNQPNSTIAKFLLTQPTHQQQQFGGSVGGPIMKDRLFYFFTYDGFRKVGKALYTDTNYLSLSPSNVTPPPAGTSASNTVTPYECPSTITSTQCNAGIQFLIDQSTAAPSRVSKEDVFFPRLDYHINSKNDAFVDFNFANFQSTNGYSGSATFTNSSPSSNGPTYYHERFLVWGLTTQVGSASVNNFHGQWGRDLETAGANAAGPSVSMGVLTFGMPNALPRIAEPDEHRYQFSDVFSTTHGRHTLKFGGDFNIVHEIMINLYQGGGLYGYSESSNRAQFQDWISDAFAGQPGNTDPYAGYHYNTLIETVDQVNTAPGTQGKDDFWMKMYDGFAEDTWKLRSNFSISAGMRYDIQLTPNPGLVNHLFDPISAQYTSSIKNVSNRIQPRVAFSWSPFVGTVVRGGYGLFSALNQGSTYYAMRVENGVVQLNYTFTGCYDSSTKSAVTPNPTCPTPAAAASKLRYPNLPYLPAGPTLTNSVFPQGGAAPTVNLPASARVSYSFHGLDPNFVPPYAHEMNLSVEQAMPGKLSLQIGYVGTRGMRLPVFVDANLIGVKPSGAATYVVQDAKNNVTKLLTVPVYRPGDRRNTALSSFNTGFSAANTWYNSMAVTVRRPFANGFEVLSNYTWAKATDTGQVGGANGTFYGGDVPSDPNNIRVDNGPSDIDIRNRFTLSFVYQPTLSLANRFVKQVVNGFQFSGSEIASGGQPIYMGVFGTINAGNANSSSYGAQGGIYGGAISSGSGGATNGRPPQIGRNSIYMPGFNDFDMRISRSLPIHDKISMQFNAEAFNLLNHQIVTGVQGTYTTFLAPGGSVSVSNSSTKYTCSTVIPPTGSTELGCFVPYQGSGLTAFGAVSSTSSSNLYGSRQLQVSAKLYF
jgi:hypothetical protein